MRPNLTELLFITIDCLRPDILGCYGGPAHTPHIDQLASEGIRYAQAYSHAHFTRPAFRSIFSGEYPWQAGVSRADPAQFSVVAQLQAAGYRTIGINSNPWLGSSFGYHKGYTVYQDLTARMPSAHSLPLVAINNLLGFAGAGYLRPPYPSCERVTQVAVETLAAIRHSGGVPDSQNRAPFFLWLHYMDAHWPYNLSNPRWFFPWEKDSRINTARFAHLSRNQPGRVSPAEKDSLWERYRTAVERIDRQVGALIDSAGSEAAVILTSDHGEAFGEHGSYYHEPNLYAENVHIPLIFRSPGTTAGEVEAGVVRHIDLVPTIQALAGINPEQSLPGIDLLPSARGDASLPELPAISWIDDPKRSQQRFAVRYQGWCALALYRRDRLELVHAELYDLHNDPMEQVNLAEKFPDRLNHLLLFLKESITGINPPQNNLADLDPQVRERLKALGYLE